MLHIYNSDIPLTFRHSWKCVCIFIIVQQLDKYLIAFAEAWHARPLNPHWVCIFVFGLFFSSSLPFSPIRDAACEWMSERTRDWNAKYSMFVCACTTESKMVHPGKLFQFLSRFVCSRVIWNCNVCSRSFTQPLSFIWFGFVHEHANRKILAADIQYTRHTFSVSLITVIFLLSTSELDQRQIWLITLTFTKVPLDARSATLISYTHGSLLSLSLSAHCALYIFFLYCLYYYGCCWLLLLLPLLVLHRCLIVFHCLFCGRTKELKLNHSLFAIFEECSPQYRRHIEFVTVWMLLFSIFIPSICSFRRHA